ncbi:bcl-2 homologous antagonist/killer, partial [Pipra filicauda]|uniref:Bcl-2 homologous antagonist/killer n=1 Tax=Pipra filicauda TaxID=649802 RepID=A0A7R5KP76_9PASS
NPPPRAGCSGPHPAWSTWSRDPSGWGILHRLVELVQVLHIQLPLPKHSHSLFESGINWGRVIALLSFGYRMAMHVFQHGLPGFLRRIARYVVEFMVQHRITRWIAQQGGWVAVLDLDNVYMKYMLVVALVVVGHLLVRRFFRL